MYIYAQVRGRVRVQFIILPPHVYMYIYTQKKHRHTHVSCALAGYAFHAIFSSFIRVEGGILKEDVGGGKGPEM